MNKFAWGVVISLSLILVGCAPPEDGHQIQPFTYVDQHDQPFGMEQLEGKIWVADFVFTNCTTVCPPMSAEMVKLQKRAKEEGLDIEFVSFTVDPTIDTPAVLKQYVETFTDDPSNWHAITGYTQEEIERFARESFRTIVQKPDHSDQVIHSVSFFLVNRQGKIMDEYNYMDETYADRMFERIHQLR